MSRLTKKEAIQHYGRNLPTPAIEKITLSTVKDTDQIYLELSPSLVTEATYGYGSGDEVAIDPTPSVVNYSKLVKVTVTLSFRFTTWEGFDVSDLTNELFENLTTVEDTNESLYVSVYMSKTGVGPNASVPKTGICQAVSAVGQKGLNFVQSLPPGSKDYYWASTAITAAGRATDYIVSVPLSQFFDVAELSADYDADNNAIVVVSNIDIHTYIRDFNEIENLTYYCATSTAHPYDLANYEKLDPISLSLNYSDFAYERVLKNSSLETISDPVFVDQTGKQYPNAPLSSLNKRYYKTEDFGSTQIIAAINELMSQYNIYRGTDAELLDVTDQTAFIIQTYRNSVDFLLLLNKAAQTFNITNEDSRAVIFSERLRIIINNADVTLRSREEVVKRMYKNYVISDLRDIVNPEMSAASYADGLTDEDFLYDELFHTNIANYVPMNAQDASYPGRSELPFSPSELIDRYNTQQNGARERIKNLLLPYDADFSQQGILDSDLPSEQKTDILNRIGNLTDALADWVYNTWSARFVKGSSDPVYRASSNHDGAHYYINKMHPDSGYYVIGDSSNPGYPKRPSLWNWGGSLDPRTLTLTSSNTIVGEIWGPEANMTWNCPPHFMDMVNATVPDAGTPYWKPGTNKWGIFRPRGISMPPRGTYSTNDRFNYNPQATIDVFGYVPTFNGNAQESFHSNAGVSEVGSLLQQRIEEADGERPDGVNSWDHASSYCLPASWAYKDGSGYKRFEAGTQTPAASVAGTDRIDNVGVSVYMDEFFWTADHYAKVQAVYRLAQQEHQVCFFVRKRLSDAGVDPSVATFNGRDRIFASTFNANSDEDGFNQPLLGDDRYHDVLNFNYKYYDFVGGVAPLFKNRAAPSTAQPDNIGLTMPASDANNYHSVSWYRCTRKKYNTVFQDVQDVVYRLYGIDPSSLTGDAGGVTPEDRGSTNPFTELDTYIQEAPAIAAEAALRDLFDQIDDLGINAIDTPAERMDLAVSLTSELIANLRSQLETYFDNPLCTLYAATVLTQPSQVEIQPVDDAELPVQVVTSRFKNYTAVTSPRASDLEKPSLPYGYWNLPRGVRNAARNNTFSYNFGRDLIESMMTIAETNQDRLREQIESYLEARAVFEGSSTDTGIHSALAEVDIVLKKYGYFFFDLEKYVRKNSILSRVVNVDRMLSYFPRAKQMTNSSIQFMSAEVKLHNFNSNNAVRDYEVPLFGESVGQQTFARLKLERDLGSDTAKSTPSDFTKMEFYSPIDPTTDAPIAYRKINSLQGISFAQITEFTSGSAYAAEVTGRDIGSTDPYARGATDSADTVSEGGESRLYAGSMGVVGGSDDGVTEDRLGTSQEEAFTALQNQASNTSLGEVDVNALLRSDFAPKDIHSMLVVRNYAFPGFNNQALFGTKWRQDYRLMMFKYQFFTDDDNAYLYQPTDEILEGPGNLSYDDIEIEIRVQDKSDKTFSAMVSFFQETFRDFETGYVQYAEEACAFDAFSQVFNKFFTSAMQQRYQSPPDTPWHRMAALYPMYQNIFTDTFAGDDLQIQQSANDILERIRPETGNLGSLRDFRDACAVMLEELMRLQDELDVIIQDSELDSRSIRVFNIRTTIGNPVVDHIGDYTKREDERAFDGRF